MEHEDFLELFYSNLRSEFDNEELVNSIEKLIDRNKFSKKNFIELLEREYHE